MDIEVVIKGLLHNHLATCMLGLLATPTLLQSAPFDRFQDCDACPEMIELPLGEFIMGAPADEHLAKAINLDWSTVHIASDDNPILFPFQGPPFRVEIDVKIAVGVNEVTFDQWMACVNDGGCDGFVPLNENWPYGEDSQRVSRSGFVEYVTSYIADGNNPVRAVTYENINTYIKWLNERTTGGTYRLPTEAEWEYAARSGTTTLFAQGDVITSDQANYSRAQSEFQSQQKRPDIERRGHPVPVDQLDAANQWGLRHMSGNIAEMTGSCFRDPYPDWAKSSQWLGHDEEADCKRAIRGGSYLFSDDFLRTASRARFYGSISGDIKTGFRVVKELD